MHSLTPKTVRILKPVLSAGVIAAVLFAACIYCTNRDLPDRTETAPEETIPTDMTETESNFFETVNETEPTETTQVLTTTSRPATTTHRATTAVPTTTTVSPATRFTQTSGFSKSDYIRTVVRLTNDYRRDAGVGTLSKDTSLMNAAQTRAEECASINNIRVNGQPHTRPDGSAWYTVFGITANYNYGENTGMGCDTPEYMMDIWMNSEGHKANILDSDYTAIGVGCAVSSDGTVYSVQIFYQP